MAEAIETQDVVRCRRFEVVDDDDVVRAVIRCTNDAEGEFEDAVILELRDPKGNTPLYLYCYRDSAAMQWWQGGNEVMRIEAARHGLACVSLMRDGTTMWEALNIPQGRR